MSLSKGALVGNQIQAFATEVSEGDAGLSSILVGGMKTVTGHLKDAGISLLGVSEALDVSGRMNPETAKKLKWLFGVMLSQLKELTTAPLTRQMEVGNVAGNKEDSVNTCIVTAFNNRFDYAFPERYQVVPEDIAHALGNICRYSGHSRKFYSVGEHCVHVAEILPKPLKLLGLLHDASEAYLVDIPSPLKQLLKDYLEIEARVSSTIYLQLCGQIPGPEDLAKIHEADVATLVSEAKALLLAGVKGLVGINLESIKVKGVRPGCWSPRKAKRMWLKAWRELTKN